jgi:predicted phosphoribosyltransferase
VSAGRAFGDRCEAGRRLLAPLEHVHLERPVVVGIARGGMAVAGEVALALQAPLDVAVVCKVGAPRNPEFAIGAVAEGGLHVIGGRAVRALGLSDTTVSSLVADAERQLERRLASYRGVREPLQLAGATAILIDDGLATGRTALAAVRSLRGRGAARVILAAPVASSSAVQALAREADEVICVEVPEDLWAVGYWYEDFSPTSDEQVAALLQGAARGWEPAAGSGLDGGAS